MNTQKAMNNHIGNMSRQAGHDVGNRYNYVVTSDELTNAYLQMRKDLGYPLMIDSKYRRAIVYNKEGLEEKITSIINDSIIENIAELERAIVEDIRREVMSALNGTTNKGNGIGSALRSFANAVTKGVIAGVGRIKDDMFK